MVVGKHVGEARSLSRQGLLLGRMGVHILPHEAGTSWLVEDQWVSRRHARITCAGGLWTISDAGASNPTFVDGSPLTKDGARTLTDGALVRLGDTLFVFRLSAKDAAPEVEGMGFPGSSPAAREVRQRLGQLQRSTGHVLIIGETGTGKERVAQALSIAEQPFVTINCAELRGDLVRSELFGHVRGSFSGANPKKGLVEAAQHGTLFLDEIGELTLDTQAELLRFLEDGGYRQVGDLEQRHSNARVVAATNVDLDEAVRIGSFRRDLLARLRAHNAPLELPALRARREDVLPWAAYFFAEARGGSSVRRDVYRDQCAAHGQWNPGAAECLLLYPWPDNLRGLRGVMRELAPHEESLSSLRAERLPVALRTYRSCLRDSEASAPPSLGAGEQPKQPKLVPAELTRELVAGTLAAHRGSVRAAAQQLGVDRRKIYRACERFGIDLDIHRGEPAEEG